jgi:hypothetical protein
MGEEKEEKNDGRAGGEAAYPRTCGGKKASAWRKYQNRKNERKS